MKRDRIIQIISTVSGPMYGLSIKGNLYVYDSYAEKWDFEAESPKIEE